MTTTTPNQTTPATIIYDDQPIAVRKSMSRDESLWLTLSELTSATKWELKPEGVCRDEVCIPLPQGKSDAFVQSQDGETWFNLEEFARFMGQPYAHDAKHNVWVFGDQPAEQQSRLASLMAPDFRLPDLEGKLHSLSDFRGKKVFLVTWASW